MATLSSSLLLSCRSLLHWEGARHDSTSLPGSPEAGWVPHMAVTHPEHSLVQAVWPLDLRVSPQAPWLSVSLVSLRPCLCWLPELKVSPLLMLSLFEHVLVQSHSLVVPGGH